MLEVRYGRAPPGPGVGSIQDPQPKKLTPGPPQNKKSIKNPLKIHQKSIKNPSSSSSSSNSSSNSTMSYNFLRKHWICFSGFSFIFIIFLHFLLLLLLLPLLLLLLLLLLLVSKSLNKKVRIFSSLKK